MDTPKKPPDRVAWYPDPQAANDSLLDTWLPRLAASNEILTEALLRVRNYLAGEDPRAKDEMLGEVQCAIEKADRARRES